MGDWDAQTADWYAEKYGEYATNRLGVARLELEPGMAVLDIGCGTAAALREVAKTVASGRLVGMDPVPRMLEIARERCGADPHGDRIELVLGGAEQLPFEDEAFDVVLAFDSMDHWKDPAVGLSEVVRVLKQDGLFAVVKDGDLSGASEYQETLDALVVRAALVQVQREQVEEDGVRFAIWLFRSARD